MSTQTRSGPKHLLDLLDRLEAAGLSYRLEHYRDAIMVATAIPGDRWEIQFLEDGPVDFERFTSNGDIDSVAMLDELFQLMADS